MSIRFSIKKSVVPKGKLIIREFKTEDWRLTSEPTQRYEDRGSLADPVGEVEDWGHLPSATL